MTMLPNFRYCHHQIVDLNFLFLHVLLLLTNNLVCSHQQTIQLFDYRQEDSSTKCTDGLLSDVDTVVFKSVVEYSQDPSMELVFFLIKRKLDEIFLFERQYNIQKDCHDVRTSGCRHIDEHTVEIFLHIKASKDISGARVRGKLITSSHYDIFSDEQIIPEIYDSKDHNVVMVINGEQKNADNDDCNYNASDSDLSIFFMLESKLSPFYIEMSSKDPDIHVQRKGHAEYHLKTNVSVRFNLTIAYYPCRMEGHVNTIRCTIQIEITEKLSLVSLDTCSVNSKIVYTILCVALVIILINWFISYSIMRLCKTRSKPGVSDNGKVLPLEQDKTPEPIVEVSVLKTICETDAPCHTLKEPMHKCPKEFVDDDVENKHDTKIEDEPGEKQETEPLIQPNDKSKDSPLPKEDYFDNKEEEAEEAHNSYIAMNRYLTLTAPGNSERDNGRITRQGNNDDELLDMLGVKKK